MAENGLSKPKRKLKKDAVPSLFSFPEELSPSPKLKQEEAVKEEDRTKEEEFLETTRGVKMPGVKCCAPDCGNYFLKTKRRQLKVAYHRFPKDPHMREIWALMCRRPFNSQRLDKCFVCSEHFTDSDYDSEIKDRVLGVQCRRRLKKEAFPRMKLNPKGANDFEIKDFISNPPTGSNIAEKSLTEMLKDCEDSPFKKQGRKRKNHADTISPRSPEKWDDQSFSKVRQTSVNNVDSLIKRIMRGSIFKKNNVYPTAMSILLRKTNLDDYDKKKVVLPDEFSYRIADRHTPGPSCNEPIKLADSQEESNQTAQQCVTSAGMVSDFVARIDSILEKVEGLDPMSEKIDKGHSSTGQLVVDVNETFFKTEVVSRINSILEKVRDTNEMGPLTESSDEELPSPVAKPKQLKRYDKDCSESRTEKNDPVYLPINEYIGGCFRKFTVLVDPQDQGTEVREEMASEVGDGSAEPIVSSDSDISEGPPSPCSIIAVPPPNITKRQKLYQFIANELKIVKSVKLSKLLQNIYSEYKPKSEIQIIRNELFPDSSH